MTNPPTPPSSHPLKGDLARLDHIVEVMWAEIHKVLRRRPPSRRRGRGSEVAARIGEPVRDELLGGGRVSPEDILSECLEALFKTPELREVESWGAFAVGIARHRAKGALRDSQAWLRGTAKRPELTVVSGDEPGRAADAGEPTGSMFEFLADPDVDLEEEFIRTSQQVELIALADELPSDRDRTIFLGLQFQLRTRQSLAEEFGLTPPGVTHVWLTVGKRLMAHPRFRRYGEGGAP